MRRCLAYALLFALGWEAMAAWGMSQAKEIEIGREMHQEILAKMPIYENAALSSTWRASDSSWQKRRSPGA
jgi:hypothetical protein